MSDFDAAISRLAELDDDRLAELVDQLDSTLSGIRNTPFGPDTQDAVAVAACARILLPKRRAAARCAHANGIIRTLTSATEN